MNARCFKTVFSKRLGARVAVGEHASSQGKATGASAAGYSPCSDAWAGSFWGALSSTFALVALVWATPAWAQPAAHALPTGGQVVQGAVQFNQSAQQLNITQSTDRAAINWHSFDIGAAAKVNIQQPSAQSVLLNRVGGESPSQIFGQLKANGQVILVNPNGMVFGKDGSVSAAGFTGSTLNISDADFMAGQARFSRSGAGTGSVLNQGRIEVSRGGYVALLGASVSNEGAIVAPQGHVFLAAADGVNIPADLPGPGLVGVPLGSSGRIRLELTPASINAAVANHKGGTIVTEGGQVYLEAAALNQAMATVLQSGSIDTTGVQGGQVHVLADGGHIRVDGQIKANSNNGTAGGDIYIGRDKDTNVLAAVGDASGAKLESKGGFVETSGQFLRVDGARVLAKEWLLDPTNITIAAGSTTSPNWNGASQSASTILASDIVFNLNSGTNVTIATSALGGDAGNITVSSAIAKTAGGNAVLTLTAHNGIIINAGISSEAGQLGVVLNALGAGGISGNATGNFNTNGGVLTLNTAHASANGVLLGHIGGDGSVVKTGPGAVTFTGSKNYSGGTTVQGGSLIANDGGGDNHTFRGFGSGAINIDAGATVFANNNSGSGFNNFTNDVTGQGTFRIGGSSVNRTLLNASLSNFTGMVDIVSRNVQFTSAVNTTAAVNVNSGAVFSAWTVHGTPTIGALSGSGTLAAVVNGNAFFVIGNGGGSGNFSGNISNSGTVGITKIGTGTQILSGNNTYTGVTAINAGTLQVGNGGNSGTLGTGAVTVASGANLDFFRTTTNNALFTIGGFKSEVQHLPTL